MSDFRIEHLPVAGLKPNPRNARLHPKKQLHQIAASIREFGFNSIVVIDEGDVILVGHGRVEAARLAGLSTVPVLRITHLTAEQKVGFSLADNKIALNSDWDLAQLQLLWRELSATDLNFDLEVTGFETAEIDLLVDGPTVSVKADRADLVPEPQVEAVSRLGDLWHLGNHRLICADACDRAAYTELLDGEQVRLVFADGPLQRSDRWPCRRPRSGQAPGVCDGVRRDDPGRIRAIPEDGIRQHGGSQYRRRRPLHLHGLASHGGSHGCCTGHLLGTQEPVRLE
jgi:hypothetical protein